MRRFLFAALVLAAPASARVASTSADGFIVEETATTPASPAQVYRAFGNVGAWWDGAHSFSGNAANLSLLLVPNGCFCERLPDRTHRHMQVSEVQPDRAVTLTGTLGPLSQIAKDGEMQLSFDRLDRGTRISLRYRVSGLAEGQAANVSAAVDQVLAEQLQRLAAAAPRF